jgi:hypothetical protein
MPSGTQQITIGQEIAKDGQLFHTQLGEYQILTTDEDIKLIIEDWATNLIVYGWLGGSGDQPLSKEVYEQILFISMPYISSEKAEELSKAIQDKFPETPSEISPLSDIDDPEIEDFNGANIEVLTDEIPDPNGESDTYR